jgi:AP-2 complex subunit beta-1
VDSPALNAHSRAVLVPLTRTELPAAAIVVPGPGPPETHSDPSPALPDTTGTKPQPPIQNETPSSHLLETSETPMITPRGDDSDGDEDGDDHVPPQGNDPYSNLDGAFGNYLADEPRPMNHAGRNKEEDDLLF